VDKQLDQLNPAQRAAVEYGNGPLLIIAGAGSGKTSTLAHRVAAIIAKGADPRRVLLLTFTRRAASEMIRRAQLIIGKTGKTGSQMPGTGGVASITWAGTFHSVANRLLRLHATSIGLDPSFTVLDREDSADLVDLLRHQLGFARTEKRFPRKATCLAIYSRTVNAQEPLSACLKQAHPWCVEWEKELGQLFSAYVDAKRTRHVLDYDDLLLYWWLMMSEPQLAERVGARFDHVLVDEYQDTNTLQAQTLLKLKPTGAGVTVVGDDAQSIYSFRAASVRNILDFPNQYHAARRRHHTGTKLSVEPAHPRRQQRGHRSCQAALHQGSLFDPHDGRAATPGDGHDEAEQVRYVAEQVLEQREAGLALKRQAVLFRAAHHSDALEVELARRSIPFVKYGGLRFLEAAHVKDMMGILRWAENPRDSIAAFRSLQLLAGVGPAGAGHAWNGSKRALSTYKPCVPSRPRAPPNPSGQPSATSCFRCTPKPRPGRDRSGSCDAGTSRAWKLCTAMPTRALATSNNSNRSPVASTAANDFCPR
jgi:DNA helicase-2/ATP-dependent DNA helicase PcrA